MAYEKLAELARLRAAYPDVSPFVILKIAMTCHGALLTPGALARVQGPQYSFGRLEPFGIQRAGRTADMALPGAILLRDASNVFINYGEAYENPFFIDWRAEEGDFVLLDGDRFVDTLDFVPRPAFFGKRSARGVPMEAVAEARAQKLILTALQRCRLWEKGQQCAFCAFFTAGKTQDIAPSDHYETVREALKERGRFSEIYLSGGLDYGGAVPFDDEVDRYIRVLQAIGRCFQGRFSSQLMAPAYTKPQLRRLYEQTGLTSYCPSIEVWDPEKFRWLCPGKHSRIGREEWIRRTVDAVEIFGPGNVCTQVVAGAELAAPHGFDSVDEALASNFEACEFFARHGVIFLSSIWRPHSAARLGRQPMQAPEYYIRLARGLHQIRKSHGLVNTNDDYKHCGNHPDSDLERTD